MHILRPLPLHVTFIESDFFNRTNNRVAMFLLSHQRNNKPRNNSVIFTPCNCKKNFYPDCSLMIAGMRLELHSNTTKSMSEKKKHTAMDPQALKVVEKIIYRQKNESTISPVGTTVWELGFSNLKFPNLFTRLKAWRIFFPFLLLHLR